MRAELYKLKDGGVLEIPFPESYSDCFELIRSDHYRKTGIKLSKSSLVKINLCHFSESSLFWLRLCQYRGRLFRLLSFIYNKVSKRVCVNIPPMTRIGYGFDIGHGMSIVINGGTVVGNNVNISHFVSIGTNHDTPAVIGDNVYIGPNTCIVEDVCICNNVTVGAGSVVVKDVPKNSTVVGCPGRVINIKNPARYIKNPYPVQ